jgi:hypothetical protein
MPASEQMSEKEVDSEALDFKEVDPI